MKKRTHIIRKVHSQPRGYLMLTAIVFGAIFVTVIGALSSFSITQNHLQTAVTGKSKALALAESGLEYYRWFLAHNPGNLTNGTGQPGPYVITQTDPEAGTVGTASLTVSGHLSCGQVTSIDIESTGAPSDGTNVTRTIKARYAQPTVAQYSYILNDSVWAGSDRIINGPYHSNGGIRMDGTANAPVTSSVSSWTCTSDFGCSSDQTKTGVFGTGPNSTLWKYPTPQLDFSGIAADFTALKTKAQASGLYFARYSSGASTSSSYYRGYHLIFNSNGTITVYKVSSTSAPAIQPVNPADITTDHTIISAETYLGTYAIPSACGLMYVEDNVWVEGVVPSKVTVVAANVVTTGVAPSAMLPDNITYANTSAGLTLIAENDVLVTGDSPNTMNLNGVFIAQNGAFGRNYYGCPSSYEPRGTLTIHGTTVSNKRTGTKWVNGCGSGSDAGYQSRVDAYDRLLATDPPPFTPTISTDYEFVDWHEE